VKSAVPVAASAALFAGCSYPAADYSAYLARMPATIVVLEPVLHGAHRDAESRPAVPERVRAAVMAAAERALVEHGYYVCPTAITLDLHRRGELPSPPAWYLFEQPSRAAIRRLTGADAALHVIVRRQGLHEFANWDTYGWLGPMRVKFLPGILMTVWLIDLESGAVLWTGDAAGDGRRPGDDWLRTAAAGAFGGICRTEEEPSDSGGAVRYDRGLLFGPRHADFAADQERMRTWERQRIQTR
jgi:hypothetical protein